MVSESTFREAEQRFLLLFLEKEENHEAYEISSVFVLQSGQSKRSKSCSASQKSG
jgi:hypothetical protein